MWKKFLLSLLIAFIPIQSWAVISMGLQHKQNALVIAQPNEATANHACHKTIIHHLLMPKYPINNQIIQGVVRALCVWQLVFCKLPIQLIRQIFSAKLFIQIVYP